MYFAGPIVLSPAEEALLLVLLLGALLTVGVVAYVFVRSIHKTVKINKTLADSPQTRDKWRYRLTFILPILTVLAVIAWGVISSLTKEARYTSSVADAVSGGAGILATGLFTISLLSAVYYLGRK